ncbi:MAG: PD-(D/E)XK nuclease family protein [Phycisphaerales bacterium]|nr:PD-(D/E)XK nuclease family protein [Phycisphaerales bacterium]
MNVGNMSPSKLEATRLCEMRLAGRLNQIEGEGEWEEEKGEGAASGTLAHAAAKHWYRPCPRWQERVRNGENPDVLAQQARVLIDACYAQHPLPNSDQDRAKQLELLRAAMDLLEERIMQEGLLKHPYTNPSYCFRLAIAECAKSQSIPGKIENELPREAANVADARELFEKIIHHYNRDNLNIVFAERRYKGKIGNGVPVHLIIDLAIDRGNGRLEITDYKTGWIALTTEEMYGKDQILTNLLAVSRYDQSLSFYPYKSFSYFWVRQNYETGPVSIPPERLTDYEHYLAVTYQHLLDLDPSGKTGPKPTESVNRFCQSCGRRTTCTKYREHVSEAMGLEGILSPEQFEAMGDEEVMAAREKISSQLKILENHKSAIDGFLKGKMGRLGQKELVAGELKCVLQQNARSDFDTATVLALCQVNGIDPATVASVGKKEVLGAFGSNAQAMNTLNMTMRRWATAPFVTVRANKTK